MKNLESYIAISQFGKQFARAHPTHIKISEAAVSFVIFEALNLGESVAKNCFLAIGAFSL